MTLMYKVVLIFLLDLTTRNSFAESKTMQVKIQSLYTAQFLNELIPATLPFGFGTDDTFTWQIDWDAGLSKRTTIRKFLPSRGGWNLITVTPHHMFSLEEDLPSVDDAGDWIIFSNYSSSLGRYYHKFQSNSTLTPNQCINTPIHRAPNPPFTLSTCSVTEKTQEFLISYAE